uniref:DNA-directed RNA polymerase subunit n=1 Tax=Starmerella magnoliae TaxID=5490 RepID=A0A0P0IQP3_9ASCO|nr:RNA polymerase III largest subunit [Starmerella magnoliae]
MKAVVKDNPPLQISGLSFGVLTPADVQKLSVVDIDHVELYNLENGRKPQPGGAIDRHMGVSDNFTECETCGGRLATCQGHFGRIKLALPVFHVGYFKHTITVLQCICKDCGALLLENEAKKQFRKELRQPLDNLRRMQILKRVNEQCKKMRRCPRCDALNGVVKKAGPLKIVHDKFRWIGKKTPDEKLEFDKSFEAVIEHMPDAEKLSKKALDDLNPLRVLNLFKELNPSDYELLGLAAPPASYLWQEVPAPPVCIRPSITQDTASNEDDLTVKLTEIVKASAQIRAGFDNGMALNELMNQWDFMQLSLALYINADTPTSTQTAPIRALCQRLKGKQGRFRGNLSGKRVDFSGRTVISPDPNLRIDEVAVPDRIAKILTYPEKVTRYNLTKMKNLVSNGADTFPGANYLMKKNEASRRNLRYGNRMMLAKNLEIGDTVERHLEDGDIVLFNRQPSLHRVSILCHRVKVRPWRTLRLNECVCTPYGADFDGDEMNLHVPQTEEARTEAMALMGVKHNIVSPRSGAPIIAATQDFISASYLVTHKDSFFDRRQLCELLSMMSDANIHYDLPTPAILKPRALWTGKQAFSLLIKPNHKSNVEINLEGKNKSFLKPLRSDWPSEMSPNDGYAIVHRSEILSGTMEKKLLGDGNKNSIFYAILRDYGPDEAAAAMNRMAKLCARYLGNRGFSIGISDVTPSESLEELKQSLVTKAYAECDTLIETYNEGKLECQPGCNMEQTLEAKVSGVLSQVREAAGDYCIKNLEPHNAPLIMALCGSKGSPVNVSQMVACVGQQIISGKRVANGFQDRTLPHFLKYSRTPASKGFVRNSFFTGLNPPEFLFHAISGREGLVDTAVKTAETGYMSRRLMKSLEDLSSLYDSTVRTSANQVVQFQYGGDGLDPMDMEGDAQPVDFERLWAHCANQCFDNAERALSAAEIRRLVDSDEAFQALSRLGADLEDLSSTVKERSLAYLTSLRAFVLKKADNLEEFAQRYPDVVVTKVYKVGMNHLKMFILSALKKYDRAKVEPGTAVGAIGAQSIGEPGTQMTLKTFHFAGVASMNVTLGVPRIKEIINASKTISTPIIKASLANNRDERTARIVKGRVEKTLLRDISEYMEDVYTANTAFIAIKIDTEVVERLQLHLTLRQIAAAIARHPKLKIAESDIIVVPSKQLLQVVIRPLDTDEDAKGTAGYSSHLLRALPDVVVCGFPEISRAVINIQTDNTKELLVEGYGLQNVMTTDGVVGTETITNHILEMRQVLGIEAARSSIINEINHTMSSHGMSVDPRHIQLLGDVMTFKGEVLGITRFGLAKMRDSVLQLASFEKTTDHLFDAAFYMKTDKIEGVSECIILGQSMHIGTGAFGVVQPFQPEIAVKQPAFESLLAH